MSTRPLRILVVDDDPAMVGAITALVGTEGHQVITAYDGLTAVKRFREEHPDLVLLDLAMPGPDGFSVAGQMRAVGQAPILVVSGESGEAAKVRALGLGADDYLTKPFGKAELLARISAIMRRVDRPGSSSGASGPLEAGGLVLEPGRHEARVGRYGAVAYPDRVPPPRGAGPRRRRHRPAPPAGPSRLAGGDRSGPALAQAAPGSIARQGGGCRRPARRRGPGRGLPDRRGRGGCRPELSRAPTDGRPAGHPGDRGSAARRAPFQTGTETGRPVASCAASAHAIRQPRASRPAIGLKWNQASPVWDSRQPQAAQVTGAAWPPYTAMGWVSSGSDGWIMSDTFS